MDSAEAKFEGDSNRNSEKSGETVSSFGDVNDDGIVDFGIGTCNTTSGLQNRVYLIPGSNTLAGSYSLSNRTFFQDQQNMYGGYHISDMGDLSGDGIADLMIGLSGWQAQVYPTQTGAEFLYPGRLSWNPSYYTESEHSFIFRGTQSSETAGTPVGLGDINGDNYNDFAVGSPNYDATDTAPLKEDTGCVYLCYGPVVGLATKSLNNCDVWLKSLTAYAGLGNRVRPLGDINGDGINDFIVSFNDNISILGDRCRLYLGRSSNGWQTSSAQSAVFYSENTGDFATHPQYIGDFNGDSWDDFAIAAPQYDTGAGKVYLFFGKSNGWTGNMIVDDFADCSFMGGANDSLGDQIAAAGDLDGDGYDDILVSGSTKVFVICGKGRDFCENANINEVADYSISGFGNGVLAGLGDVNNDGYPDIAISNQAASSYRGVTYVFFGGRD